MEGTNGPVGPTGVGSVGPVGPGNMEYAPTKANKTCLFVERMSYERWLGPTHILTQQKANSILTCKSLTESHAFQVPLDLSISHHGKIQRMS